MSEQKTVVAFFTLFLTVYFLESIGGFFMASVVVSIEKQFQISSRMSGLMVSAGDFGYIPSVVFVSYFGSKGNRARWIGAGSLMIAFADILIGMSNFLFPVRTAQLNSALIGESSVTAAAAGWSHLNGSMQASAFSNYAWSFSAVESFPSFLQQSDQLNATEISKIRILIGSPLSFCSKMFNALKQEISGMRCSSGLSNVGPFVTIFAGLLILGIGRTMPYSLGLPLIDDNVKRQNLPLYFVPAGLTPRDPSWIGRWWAGFLGIGIAMLCPSLILYLYPTCVNYKFSDLRAEHCSGVTSNLDDHAPSEIHSLVNERVEVEKRVREKGLVLIDRHAMRDDAGNTVVPTSAKAKIIGVASLLGFAIGLFVGGLIMRKFKLQGRKAAAYILVCSLIAAVFSLNNAMIGCKSVLSSISDEAKSNDRNFTTKCNSNCNCVGMPLHPIFRNCSCSNSTDSEVSRDFCLHSVCKRKFTWYFLNLALSCILGGLSIIPAVLIVLRSVPPVDRSISLGFQGFLVSLIATLPSSVFWGWINDNACVMWNTVCAEKSRGACELYDSDKLRLTTHLTYSIISSYRGIFAVKIRHTKLMLFRNISDSALCYPGVTCL
ncbi:unnamed protein product [Litomosoides sigmodontis]|uniref:Solute carrier organic anion transporter family member n=1 Tax=Litomosoides sigmodontis TaxID=42156 RepID=A0A3P6T7I2_LITSI|nr:unnamed protein product [Litomosoides sigmodontis]